MAKFVLGLAIGILLVPAGLYLYLRSGYAPVAASASPMPFERFMAKTALRATIDHQAPTIPPVHVTDASLGNAAQLYRQDCAVCHGLPGQPPTSAAAGMYPRPPQFFRANAEKIDDPAGEIYWKVENGIRLTGMPGFHASLTPRQVRGLAGFLGDATELPPAVIAVLDAAPAAAPEGGSPAKRPASSKHKGA